MDNQNNNPALPTLSLALTKGQYLSRTVDIEAEERASQGDSVINTLKFQGEFPRISVQEYQDIIKDKNNAEAVYAVAKAYPDRFCIWGIPLENSKERTTREHFNGSWHYEENAETSERIPLHNDLLDMLFTKNFISMAIANHMSVAINELPVKETISRSKKGN
jgi:hypothetical protein